MSEIQRFPAMVDANPVHPNAKTTTQINNGTTTTKSNISSPVCRNCKTQTTPLWRRDETGQVLCNACGLFLKLHGRPRPISLKTDTIKLRNRIKQPNFAKLGPNTPELKLKDAKLGKRLPKSAKKKSAPSPPPEMHTHLPLATHTRAPFPQGFAPLGHVAGLPHQVQLLHYPLSTPTQFAPGLQRITSPLLLLTTALVLNARATLSLALPKGLSAVQAAGALENMLNELGPSATFKSGVSLNGGLLMGGMKRSATPVLSTPSTALAGPKLPALSTEERNNVIASPSFGPQFHLDHSTKSEPLDQPRPALPPLQHVQPAQAQLPRFQSNFGSVTGSGSLTPVAPISAPVAAPIASLTGGNEPRSSSGASANGTGSATSNNNTGNNEANSQHGNSGPPNSGPVKSSPGNSAAGNSGPSSGPGRDSSGSDNARASNNGNNNGNNNGSNNNGNNGNGESAYEINLLKTRISELELVNDLYRTRIMELEAMEQAARLRESSMRKRLDEILNLQGQDSVLQRALHEPLKRPKLG